MKSKNIVVALTTLFALTTLNASTGVFDFETLSGDAQAWIEGEGNGNTCTQATPHWTDWGTYGGMTWNTTSNTGVNGYLTSGGFLGGVISNSKSNTGSDYSSDLNTVVGGGSGGSSNFAMMFLMEMVSEQVVPTTEVINGITFDTVYRSGRTQVASQSFLLDAGQDALKFTSIDLCLNVYTNNGLLNGDSFQTGGTLTDTPNSFYSVRIYGVDENMQVITDNYVDHFLAYNNGEDVLLQNTWESVSLNSLNNGEAVYGLSFEVMTNFGTEWGMTPSAMVAVDNITYTTAVPEPAEWATIFGGIALAFVIYRNRVKK